MFAIVSHADVRCTQSVRTQNLRTSKQTNTKLVRIGFQTLPIGTIWPQTSESNVFVTLVCTLAVRLSLRAASDFYPTPQPARRPDALYNYAAAGHANHDANCSIYANASCCTSRHGRARAVDGPCASGHHDISRKFCSEGSHHNRSIHCRVHGGCHTPGGKTTAGGIGRFEFARPIGLRDEAE